MILLDSQVANILRFHILIYHCTHTIDCFYINIGFTGHTHYQNKKEGLQGLLFQLQRSSVYLFHWG